jgi:hypothetical protein
MPEVSVGDMLALDTDFDSKQAGARGNRTTGQGLRTQGTKGKISSIGSFIRSKLIICLRPWGRTPFRPYPHLPYPGPNESQQHKNMLCCLFYFLNKKISTSSRTYVTEKEHHSKHFCFGLCHSLKTISF